MVGSEAGWIMTVCCALSSEVVHVIFLGFCRAHDVAAGHVACAVIEGLELESSRAHLCKKCTGASDPCAAKRVCGAGAGNCRFLQILQIWEQICGLVTFI